MMFCSRRHLFVRLLAMLVVLAGIAGASMAGAAELGRVVSVDLSRDVVRAGGNVEISITVESNQPGQNHHMVAVNIIVPDGDAIYDSNQRGKNLDFVIRGGNKQTLGPLTVTIPEDTKAGIYHVLIGYRVYPWEPLIQFYGTDWAPPVKQLRIR